MFASSLALSALFLGATAAAQDLELPVPSPRASVAQQVGTLTVTVDYASPGRRDRDVWGELVPYGKLWRTGANAATTFTTTGDLRVAGKPVPAGTYSVFTLPDAEEWTVVLNKNPSATGGSYDQAQDQLRFTARPAESADRERLTFLFTDTTEDSTRLDLEWAGLRVGIPIEVDSAARAKSATDAYVQRSARRLADAGAYRAGTGDTAGGLALVDKSLALHETWFGHWTRAQVLKQHGDAKNAYKAAQKTMEVGKKAGEGFWGQSQVQAALDSWPKK